MTEAMVSQQAQKLHSERANGGQHAIWIAGRVQVLLSHYFQPDNPTDVLDAAIDDWVEALTPFSQAAIEHACRTYLRDQPRRRPTPGDIRGRSQAAGSTGSTVKRGNKSELTYDELELLENKLIPTARRWLDIPDLRDHGRQFLDHWGEA